MFSFKLLILIWLVYDKGLLGNDMAYKNKVGH